MKHVSVIAVFVLVFIAFALAGVAVQLGGDRTVVSESQSFSLEHSTADPQVPLQPRVLETRAFTNLGLPVRKVTIGTEKFSLAVANTKESRVSGLSNVDSMQYYDGMLFEFPQPATHGFWMKDMRFPLDIIWLNEMGEVIHIEERLSPDTYPRVYKPEGVSQYVIELNAGVVADVDLQVGDQIRIFGQAVAVPGE